MSVRVYVMAAGLGTRLQPLTGRTAKPMVPILNRPVMEHLLRLLRRHGLTEVAANLYYHPEKIRAHFGDGSAFGLEAGKSYDFKLTSAAFAADLFGSAATRPDVFPEATNATYHVSPVSGNDTNNGTAFAQAFRSLAKALSVANAGAKILLHDGLYYEGDLSAPRSGTASAPIVIEAAPGARPVLNGLDIEIEHVANSRMLVVNLTNNSPTRVRCNLHYDASPQTPLRTTRHINPGQRETSVLRAQRRWFSVTVDVACEPAPR